MPVIRSTLSRLVNRSIASRATSGLLLVVDDADFGSPPSLPPSFTASREASHVDAERPRDPTGAENPTLTLSAAPVNRAPGTTATADSNSADIVFS